MGYVRPPYYFTAYGLAVKHGFQGTEQEWLDSLKGTKMLTVHISGNDIDGYTADKTLEEVRKANASELVRCVCDGRYLPLEYIDEERAAFAAVNDEGDSRVVVELDAQGAVRVEQWNLSGKDHYVVELTADVDPFYKADKSLQEVQEVYLRRDRKIICKYTAGETEYNLPLVCVLESGVIYGAVMLGVTHTAVQTEAAVRIYSKRCAESVEVTLSGSVAEGYTSDVGIEDICNADQAGQGCVCLWDGLRLPLVCVDDGVAFFSAVVDGICYQVEIGPDGVKAGETVVDNRTQLVTVSGSEETGYTCAYRLNAILSVHNQGPVECLIDGLRLPLVSIDGSQAIFTGPEIDGSGFRIVQFDVSNFSVLKKPIGGNSGGTGDSGGAVGDVFYINFDGTEGDYGLASSRAEIVAAYEAGKELRCLVPVGTGVADIPLVHKTVDEDGVELCFGGSSAYLKESEGGRTVSAFIGIRDGGVEWGALLHPVVRDGKYIVNISSDGHGGYEADKTYNGVLAVHNAKVLPIECRITVGDISYVVPLCGLVDGRLIYGGSAGGLSLAVLHGSDESIAVMSDTLVTNSILEEALAGLGGGGGNIELIASGTNTEAVRRFRINADNDGNAFELTRAFFVIKNILASGTDGNQSCHVTLGGTITNVGTLPTESRNRDVIAYADINGVMWAAQGGGGIYAQGGLTACTNFAPNTTIQSAEFTCAAAGQTFQAGATYELWGVRK